LAKIFKQNVLKPISRFYMEETSESITAKVQLINATKKIFKQVFNVPEIWGLLFQKWLYMFFLPPHT